MNQVIGLPADQCADVLQACIRKLDRLMSFVERPRLPVTLISEVQGLLAEIKDELEKECGKRSGKYAGQQLSKWERDFLLPAFEQAKAELTIRRSSRPNPEWYSELYRVRGTLAYALFDINDVINRV